MKKLALVCGAVLALTLALGATGGALAASAGKHATHAQSGQHKKKGSLVKGIVQAVGSDSITLKLKDGSTKTISVTSQTKIVVNHKAGSLSDIEVGYRAYVKLAADGSAKAIRSYEKGAKRNAVAGVVDSVGSSSITLKLKDGSTKTVDVTADTKIFVNGKPGSLGDVEVGYHTVIRLADNGSAAVIRSYEKAKPKPGKGRAAKGLVASVGSDSITLTLKGGGSVTIQVTAATKIRVAGKPGAGLSDIQAGFHALVLRAAADGPALAIIARPPKS